MKEKRKRNWREWAIDFVHLIFLIVLLIYTFRAVICVDQGLFKGNFFYDLKEACLQAGINEIFTFIGAVSFILFGIIGIYDFAYLNGVRILVPPSFIHLKEKNYEKQAEKMMKVYYERDIEFIQEYEKERMGYLLQVAGIDEAQFRHIRYELIKARAKQAENIEELRNKTEMLLYNRQFIVNQTSYSVSDRIYKEVGYFINLYTALYDSELCNDVAHIMADYIVMCLGVAVVCLDYIIIPQGSNLLLGLEVGKILRKPIIAIQEKERITKNEFWDGNYEKKLNAKNNVIIVHDVLVTGKRIYQSIEKLPKDTYEVKGLFCLFKYKNPKYHPEWELEKHNINNIKCLVDTDETRLQKVYEERKSGL